MRIALVTPEWPGCGSSYGVGTYVAVLARSLRSQGCQVRILVVNGAGRWRIDDGQPCRLGAQAGPAVLRPRLARAWIRRELQAFAPEVVEYPNWGGLGGGLSGIWRRAIRLSTPVSSIASPDLWRRIARSLHHQAELASVRQADVVIADSVAMAGLSRQCYGRDAHAVIPHAWDGPRSRPADDARDVLFVGRLEPRKGVDVLLQAWQQVHPRHPASTLHLVGADRHGFGAACLGRFGSGGVVAHGRIDDAALAALRQRCAIQAVPSRFESFGMVVLEAWASGLAVVAASGGALTEVVGDAGSLVAVDDAPAFANALLAMLGDAGLRARTVALGTGRLDGLFSPVALARASLAAYARSDLR